ncbi:MAG: RagB/SusD family nutrient uptake outer membrane protein [Gemmatimonadota bacterium]
MNRRMRHALTTAVALMGLGAVGCTDTSVNPLSTVSEVNIFSNPAAYQQFLAKVYGGLAVTGQQGPAGNRDISSITDEGFSSYLRIYWEMQELPTDEAIIGWGDQGLPELNTATWGSANRFVAGMFSRVYFQIGMANEFLRQTTDAKLSERKVTPSVRATVQQYRAEARFLRAFSYWHGLDFWGNIPVVTTIQASPPAQNTRQEVYDFIVSELTAIQADLPAAGPGTYGRATKEAASMLLANVYLNAEVYTGTPHYAEALVAAQAAINGPFSIDPTYQNMFLADNNNSPEIIFPVVQDGQHTQSYGAVTFITHASCGASMSNVTYGLDGCWWGIRLKPEAYNLFAAGDARSGFFYTSGQTVAINNIGDFTNGIAAPKFQNVTSTGAPGSNSQFADTDWPVFRLAEAYLIYAEAAVRTNTNLVQALAYVNALQDRAFGAGNNTLTAPQLTLQFLLDERGRELLWEGHRRTDLIRFGVFSGGTYLWAWKGNVQAGTATDAHLDLFPIPATEISANPNLKQNTGY